jgi:hypothetical protein
MHPRVTASVAIAAAVLVLAGCGRIAEEAAERAVEEIAEEAAGGGEIDINTEDGSVEVQTDEGAISVDEDGNVVITDADGNVVSESSEEDGRTVISTPDGESTFTVGEGSLPEDWPGPQLSDAFTPINGSRVEAAQNSWTAGYSFAGALEDGCAAVQSAFSDWTETFKTETTGDGANCFMSYENDVYQANATLTQGDRVEVYVTVVER